MIPIKDNIASTRIPWVSRFIIFLNVVVFLFEAKNAANIESILYSFGVVPSYWSISSFSELFRLPILIATLISFQFLHGSILHLISNMLYLWVFGDNVEDKLGHGRFAALYFLSGAVSGLVQITISPQSTVPMVGASGAISGVLGAYFILFPYANIVTVIPLIFTFHSIELPAFLFLGIWFILQWLQGVSNIGQVASLGGVAWWAHVGGFVSGLALVYMLRTDRKGS
jgi:membrane associated rhomboid family serine protease